MKIYLVGGAVRDSLLNIPVKDRDWVVTGASAAELLAQGYQQVGADFPVFLHPDSHEEYALARTERKKGRGYKGFSVDASPEVTLEEDLLRRDLTINAIARDEHGQLTDPYGGCQDLQQKLLRHVSPAFTEDPLRVLRVARFATRFDSLGFRVAGETMALMQQMVSQGELEDLVPERVWQETVRAMSEASPVVYWQTLRQAGALKVLFPELDRLFGIPQAQRWHPEVDTGIHTLMVLQQAAILSQEPAVRFASLCHDLGKGTTPAEQLPGHMGHEQRGVELVRQLCKRVRAPRQFTDLALRVCQWHTHCHRIAELDAADILNMLKALNAYKQPEVLEQFLLCCEADYKGRSGWEQLPYRQKQLLRNACTASQDVPVQPLIEAGYQGPELGQAIDAERIKRILEEKKTWPAYS